MEEEVWQDARDFSDEEKDLDLSNKLPHDKDWTVDMELKEQPSL